MTTINFFCFLNQTKIFYVNAKYKIILHTFLNETRRSITLKKDKATQ